MRSSQIGFDPTVQQQKSWAVQIGKLHSDGQITERRIHTYPFDDENVRCCGSGVCTASKVRLNPRLISQSLQCTKVTLKTQYFQAKPRCCSYRVALSYRLIEFTLSRLLMLEPICLTAPERTFAVTNMNVRHADKAAVQFLCFADAASVCGCSMFMLRCSLSR